MAWNKVPEINNPYTKKHPQKEPIKRYFDPADAPKPAVKKKPVRVTSSKGYKKKLSKKDRLKWWNALTIDQQREYIERKTGRRMGSGLSESEEEYIRARMAE